MAGCWYIMRGLWLSVSMIHMLSAVREGSCSWSWGLSSLACGFRKGCPEPTSLCGAPDWSSGLLPDPRVLTHLTRLSPRQCH